MLAHAGRGEWGTAQPTRHRHSARADGDSSGLLLRRELFQWILDASKKKEFKKRRRIQPDHILEHAAAAHLCPSTDKTRQNKTRQNPRTRLLCSSLPVRTSKGIRRRPTSPESARQSVEAVTASRGFRLPVHRSRAQLALARPAFPQPSTELGPHSTPPQHTKSKSPKLRKAQDTLSIPSSSFFSLPPPPPPLYCPFSPSPQNTPSSSAALGFQSIRTN